MEALALMIIAAIPTTIGTAEAVNVQKKQQDAEKHSAKFHLLVDGFLTRGGDKKRRPMRRDCFLVLKDGNMFIDHPARPVLGHKFCGYYFDYPGRENCRGLVSSVQDDPPMLNWIYVDKDTLEVRYGNRKDTIDHIVGPWDWTEDEANLTLEDDEGFVVIQQADGTWKVYYDRNGDGSDLPEGKMREI